METAPAGNCRPESGRHYRRGEGGGRMTACPNVDLTRLYPLGGFIMSPKEAVLAKYPDAVARCVLAEAHAAESHERRLHWEVRSGPHAEAVVLGLSLVEEGAWSEAAVVVLAECVA